MTIKARHLEASLQKYLRKSALAGFFLIFFVGYSFIANGQARIQADAKIIEGFKKRTLVVEILEPNQQVMNLMQGIPQRGSAEWRLKEIYREFYGYVDDYKRFIDSFNTVVKNHFNNLWTFNSSIEFKKSSEIDALFANPNAEYVVLYYTANEESVYPSLVLSRPEMGFENIDYSFFLPMKEARLKEGCCYKTFELNLAFKMMQQHLNEIVKVKEVMTFSEFAINQADAKCGKNEDFIFWADKILLDKDVESADLKDAFPGDKAKKVKFELLDELINTGKESNYLTVIIFPGDKIELPESLKAQFADKVIPPHTRLKLVVDMETGAVHGATIDIGPNIIPTFGARELKKALRCN